MKIALGSDHTGVEHKKLVRAYLETRGIERIEFGSDMPVPVDYPDIALNVAQAVAEGECDFGILLCGTGIGVGMMANKVPGILAAVCHDEYSTRMSRTDDHANVLCLGARGISPEEAVRLADIWLHTQPEGGRHARRVARILELERAILQRSQEEKIHR